MGNYPPKVKILKSLTVNVSTITTQAMFTGHFKTLTVSVSTQSNAAINIQAHGDEGFQAPLPEAGWKNVLAISALSAVWAVNPVPMWSRVSTPASSNATITFLGVPY